TLLFDGLDKLFSRFRVRHRRGRKSGLERIGHATDGQRQESELHEQTEVPHSFLLYQGVLAARPSPPGQCRLKESARYNPEASPRPTPPSRSGGCSDLHRHIANANHARLNYLGVDTTQVELSSQWRINELHGLQAKALYKLLAAGVRFLGDLDDSRA